MMQFGGWRLGLMALRAVYIIIKEWSHRYAFGFCLMVVNDKLRSMIAIAFQSDGNR